MQRQGKHQDHADTHRSLLDLFEEQRSIFSPTAQCSIEEASKILLECTCSKNPESSYPKLNQRSSNPSIHVFAEWLRKSTRSCIGGEGLHPGCIYVYNSLEIMTSDSVSVEDLQEALGALWDEVEIQDYPRRVMFDVPKILLHKNVISLCLKSESLKALMSDIILQLQRTSDHRVYMFTPLAEALRKATLLEPRAACLLPIAELISRFAKNPPTLKTEFELEEIMASKLIEYAPHRTYESYYGKSQGYGYACVLDLLNKFTFNKDCMLISRNALDMILDPWLCQKDPPPVYSPWKNTTQLQAMYILFENFLPLISEGEVVRYQSKLLKILGGEPQPRYRFLLEWMVGRTYVFSPSKRRDIFRSLDSIDISNPKLCISIIKLTIMLARLPDADKDFSLELMTQLAVLTANPKIAIRHEAMWQFPIHWDHVTDRGWTSILNNPVLQKLNDFIRNLDTYKNPPAGRRMEAFDLVDDHNLTFLLEGGYMELEPKTETPIVRREDLVAVYKDDELDHALKTQRTLYSPDAVPLMPLGAPIPSRHPPPSPLKQDLLPINPETTSNQQSKPTSPPPLQTKSLLPSKPTRHPIQIIATLVSNHANLGGLSRISEALGAASLHFPNPATVTASRDFTSTSVSSHLHLPIHDLPLKHLQSFLLAQKTQGWSVVGVEQTDQSYILGGAEPSPVSIPEDPDENGEGNAGTTLHSGGLPRKRKALFALRTTLLLGSERTGIPGGLLGLCDWCVEIPQVGVTRSLNVQTAAGLVLFEYARQMEGRGRGAAG